MLKKGLLFIACVLFVISSPVFGEELATEATAGTTTVAKSVEIEPSKSAGTHVVEAASEWNAPEWLRDSADMECGGVAAGLFAPGRCNDCAGGCSINCSNDNTCMQRCPNHVGICVQGGKCLCAC